ncbi:MAG: hypothetical protein NXY57DRAFT_1042384 [Lentinula lateritia]|nr:MAG: hypothetical protein NXY57DRAFT_1042384 [Lentinula lateritia]
MASEYQPLSKFTGPCDAVISLAFSAKGKFLAAAGYSGVYVWNLSTCASTPLPHMLFAPQNPKYVINAAVWVYFHKNNQHILLLGSMQGDIILWNWDDDSQMLSSSGEFSKVFSTVLDDNFKPKTVQMCKKTRDIFVFPLYGGEILCLDYKLGAIKSRKSPGPGRMGSVSLNCTSDKFVAYTGKNFQLYRLSNLEILKTFMAEAPLVFFPKQVAFGEADTIVVGERIMPVATLTLPGQHLISIAGSTQEQPSDVMLFEKTFPKVPLALHPEVAPNEPTVPMTGFVHVGFYIPKKVLKWIWIVALLLSIFASYYTIPQYLQQISSRRNEVQWMTQVAFVSVKAETERINNLANSSSGIDQMSNVDMRNSTVIIRDSASMQHESRPLAHSQTVYMEVNANLQDSLSAQRQQNEGAWASASTKESIKQELMKKNTELVNKIQDQDKKLKDFNDGQLSEEKDIKSPKNTGTESIQKLETKCHALKVQITALQESNRRLSQVNKELETTKQSFEQSNIQSQGSVLQLSLAKSVHKCQELETNIKDLQDTEAKSNLENFSHLAASEISTLKADCTSL